MGDTAPTLVSFPDPSSVRWVWERDYLLDLQLAHLKLWGRNMAESSMAASMKPYLGYFFPGDCYEEVVVNYEIFDARCLKLLYSRMISLSIVLGSMLVKVPQIVKCVRAHSVENLSYLSFFLELVAVTFTCTYNMAKGFPFSLWGESFFVSIQVIILLGLMFYYNDQAIYMVVVVPVYGAVVWYLTSDYVSMEVLGMLQASAIPIYVTSRLSQVVTTFMNKTTGQLSYVTCLLNWLGTGSRIFTTIQETGDILILVNFTIGFFINSIILLQFYCYPPVQEGVIESRKKLS